MANYAINVDAMVLQTLEAAVKEDQHLALHVGKPTQGTELERAAVRALRDFLTERSPLHIEFVVKANDGTLIYSGQIFDNLVIDQEVTFTHRVGDFTVNGEKVV